MLPTKEPCHACKKCIANIGHDTILTSAGVFVLDHAEVEYAREVAAAEQNSASLLSATRLKKDILQIGVTDPNAIPGGKIIIELEGGFSQRYPTSPKVIENEPADQA